MKRPDVLRHFIDALSAAARSGATSGVARSSASRIFGALESPENIVISNPQAEPLPACTHFASALHNASSGPLLVQALSDALLNLAPLLRWQRRAGAENQGKRFSDGHANTWIVSPDGLEQRDDVIVGASLLAPGVDYPPHQHGPEELYIVMSVGDWYRDGVGWYTPGMGGVVHHEPWVTHAMRSGAKPLLAVWCLWTDTGE